MGDDSPICTLAALVLEMLGPPSVIPHCCEWSVCSIRVLRPQIFLCPALPALCFQEQDWHIPGDVLLRGHTGLFGKCGLFAAWAETLSALPNFERKPSPLEKKKIVVCAQLLLQVPPGAVGSSGPRPRAPSPPCLLLLPTPAFVQLQGEVDQGMDPAEH